MLLALSLILSVTLLVSLNVMASEARSIRMPLSLCIMPLGLCFVFIILPGLLLQAFHSFVGGLVCAWLAPRRRVFLGTIVAAFLLAYISIGGYTWLDLSRLH